MCWQSNICSECIPNVSENDIVCYKVMYYDYRNERYVSRILSYIYESGTKYSLGHGLNPSDIDPVNDGMVSINEGFHSYDGRCRLGGACNHIYIDSSFIYPIGPTIKVLSTLRNDAMMFSTLRHYGVCLVECTIPAGSEYYENGSGEIVSNAIIPKRRRVIVGDGMRGNVTLEEFFRIYCKMDD